jgi:hypothetical protein
MNVQMLPTGKIFVEYGDPVEYQSSLWIVSACETEVVYSDSYQGAPIARVYKKDGEWYLSTAYLNHWQPVPSFSKYGGFLFLMRLREGKIMRE